jgi:hypothetical protein
MITTTCLIGVVVASPALGGDADPEGEVGNAASAAPPAKAATAVRQRPRTAGMKYGVLIDDLLSPKG